MTWLSAIPQPTHGTAQSCMDVINWMCTSSSGAQSIPGELLTQEGWSDWVALIILSSSFWKTSVASACGISMRRLFLSHLSSKLLVTFLFDAWEE